MYAPANIKVILLKWVLIPLKFVWATGCNSLPYNLFFFFVMLAPPRYANHVRLHPLQIHEDPRGGAEGMCLNLCPNRPKCPSMGDAPVDASPQWSSSVANLAPKLAEVVPLIYTNIVKKIFQKMSHKWLKNRAQKTQKIIKKGPNQEKIRLS